MLPVHGFLGVSRVCLTSAVPIAPTRHAWVPQFQEAQQACAGGHLADRTKGDLLRYPIPPSTVVLLQRRGGSLSWWCTLLDRSLCDKYVTEPWCHRLAWHGFYLQLPLSSKPKGAPGAGLWFKSYNNSMAGLSLPPSLWWIGFTIKSSPTPGAVSHKISFAPCKQSSGQLNCYRKQSPSWVLATQSHFIKAPNIPLQVIRHYLWNKIILIGETNVSHIIKNKDGFDSGNKRPLKAGK